MRLCFIGKGAKEKLHYGVVRTKMTDQVRQFFVNAFALNHPRSLAKKTGECHFETDFRHFFVRSPCRSIVLRGQKVDASEDLHRPPLLDVLSCPCYRKLHERACFDVMTNSPSLEQQLLEYRAILEHAGIAVIFTRNQRVERCNKRAEALFGWPSGSLVGQSGRVFYPNDAGYEALGRAAGPVLTAGDTYEADVTFARRDATLFLGHVIARPIDPSNGDAGTIWIASDVTVERQEAVFREEVLREQQQIFDRAEIGIAYVRNRKIQRCNRRFEEMIGFAPGEAVGKSTREYFRSDEEWQTTGQVIYHAIASTGAYDGEWILQRLDGKTIWCRFSGSMLDPLRPELGYIWLHEDVTAKRQIEQALAEAHRQQKLVFDNALVGVSYLRNRVIVRCNRRFEDIFGFTPGELTGQSMRVLYESEESYKETARRVRDHADPVLGFSGAIRYRHRDGHMIWVQVNGRPVMEGDDEVWIWTHQDITRAYEIEDALRRSHAELEQRVAERTEQLKEQLHLLQQLIEAIPGPVFYKDQNGCYLGCNRAYADFIGIKSESLIGKTVHDIAPADLADRYKAADDDLFRNPGGQVYESQIQLSDGKLREVMFHKATFLRADGSVGGIVGVILDITARKHAEEALEENREKYRALSEAAFEAIFISEEERCIEQNKRAELMFGYPLDEALGRMATDWFVPEDRERVMENMLLNFEQPYEVRALRKDGSTFPAMIRARRATYKGFNVRITSLNDITERKAAEAEREMAKQEVDALNASLEHRVADAVQALENSHQSLMEVHQQLTRAETMASLGRMVAVIAHELNTPIGNSRLAASTLREFAHEFSEKMASGVKRSDLENLICAIDTGTLLLDSGLQRAAHLISSFKQIAVDQTSSHRRRFPINELIDEIATTLEPSIRRSGCTLSWNHETDIHLDSYPGPLSHVLINLIDNAMRHAFIDRPPGAIKVFIGAKSTKGLEIRVSDNGVGIKGEHQKHIFEPFFTTQMGRGGTGLGLSIAYNMVTGVLGGVITVASEPGLGACFELLLPLSAPVPVPVPIPMPQRSTNV